MDNCNLSLNNFSSIFELLGTYYILLSLSDKLEEHLGLSAIFKNWHTSLSSDNLAKRLDYLKNEMSNSKNEIISKIGKQKIKNQALDLLKNYNKNNEMLQKEANKTSKFIKKGDGLLVKINLHLNLTSKNQPTFSELIKPAYVFSGIAILAVLFLSGVVGKWNGKYLNLYFINLSLILVFFISIIQIVRLKPFKFLKGNLIFFSAVVFYLVLTIIPSHWLCVFPLKEYNYSTRICIDDFHILLFLGLIFLPLFIHLISLNILYIRCNWYTKNLDELLSEELPNKVEGGKKGEIKGIDI
jgi:hypothetical protein